MVRLIHPHLNRQFISGCVYAAEARDIGLGLSAALQVAQTMRLFSVEGEERIRKYI